MSPTPSADRLRALLSWRHVIGRIVQVGAAISNRERLLTVFHGQKADRVPLTVYAWIYRWAKPGSPPGARSYSPFLAMIDTRGVCRESPRNVTVDRTERTERGRRQVLTRVSTPLGELTERVEFDPTVESRWIREHLIKSVEDYAIVKYICDHTELEPAPEDYLEADSGIGEQGIVVGGLSAIPLQWLATEAMGTEAWCEGLMEHPDEFEELHESVSKLYRRRVEIAADSPAAVMWFADSLTGATVSPDVFNRYCRDLYDYACALFRQAGKRTLAHFDGANGPLKDCIANSGIDIIEAFTPPPMGRMTVAEARDAWPDKVLSVNFPGNLFTEPDGAIEAYTAQYLEEGGREGKFVIGCTEEFPRHEFDRVFSAIARAMNEYETCSR
jgi:hypothetical protein